MSYLQSGLQSLCKECPRSPKQLNLRTYMETLNFFRRHFGKNLKKYNYDQAIILTNSLKSSLIPFFARIPIRTGWLGEMRYGLLNDIRYLDKNKNHLMVEKFAALSMQDSNYCLESLSFPKLTLILKINNLPWLNLVLIKIYPV